MMREAAKTILARRLRKGMNTPEQAAWRTLRELRDHGFPVRRQHPVGRFVVDFAIASKKIVIEVDGGVHKLPEKIVQDASREDEITALGWRVIRVPTEVALSEDNLSALMQKELGL